MPKYWRVETAQKLKGATKLPEKNLSKMFRKPFAKTRISKQFKFDIYTKSRPAKYLKTTL